jgi:hypothetical protein
VKPAELVCFSVVPWNIVRRRNLCTLLNFLGQQSQEYGHWYFQTRRNIFNASFNMIMLLFTGLNNSCFFTIVLAFSVDSNFSVGSVAKATQKSKAMQCSSDPNTNVNALNTGVFWVRRCHSHFLRHSIRSLPITKTCWKQLSLLVISLEQQMWHSI